METRAAAARIFSTLDSDGNGRLDANEVSVRALCQGEQADARVSTLIGLDRDQFVGRVVGAAPASEIQRVAARIEQASASPADSVGARIGRFLAGLGMILLAVIALPLEILAFVLVLPLALVSGSPGREVLLAVPWYLFATGGTELASAFSAPQRTPYDQGGMERLARAFIAEPAIAGPSLCVGATPAIAAPKGALSVRTPG
jgi:hypothetical protein